MNFPIRVYYEDTDHGGVVYYANYLKFMERGRTEFLRSHNIELDRIYNDYGVMFVVTEVNIRYKGAAHFNDLIHVETLLTQASGVRIAFIQRIQKKQEPAQKTILTDATVQLACVNREGKPCLIPKALLSTLQQQIHQGIQG
ncbi:MAG: tol-pal system-associated acyl-CoA thioesterase [Proteobacteria bacterium]|nr:MAG: tol-pal system-associated acyl-CoA thioesterase [Pseudomonadota bacterium]